MDKNVKRLVYEDFDRLPSRGCYKPDSPGLIFATQGEFARKLVRSLGYEPAEET